MNRKLIKSPGECRLSVAAEGDSVSLVFGLFRSWRARVWVDGMPSATLIIVAWFGRPPYIATYTPILYMGFIPRSNDVHTDATRLGISVDEFRREILALWTLSQSDLNLELKT